ncbi:MAG: hypothetical protein H0V25_06830 [Solirubrobacterales bacterium]|nr:hypothetical protein [Solirubrobacterales bacterium]
MRSLPGGRPSPAFDRSAGDIAVPLRLQVEDRELAFISTVMTFGTATDVTVAELAIESFFPANAVTADAVHAHAGSPTS